MINFTQYQYFLIVAEEKSFTKAAKKLFISQQSLSTHIQNIEKDLNVKLFYRTSPLSLTYAGQIFQEYALKMTSLHKELFMEMNDINNKQKGEYRIGISYNRGAILLPQILPTLKKEFPFVEFYINESNYTILQQQLTNGQLDVIIEQLPFTNDQISHIEICEDQLNIIVSDNFLKNHFNDPDKIKRELYETGRITPLAGCTFLLNKPGNSIRSKIEDILVAEGIEPENRIVTENMNTLLNLCMNDFGITFYPSLFFNKKYGATISKNINIIPLSYPSTKYTLALGYQKGHYLSKVSLRLIDILKEVSKVTLE